MEWFFLIAGGILLFILFSSVSENDERRRLELEAEERKAERDAAEARRESQLVVWATGLQTEGWSHVGIGKMMHIPGQPRCIIALSATKPLLRFDEVEDGDEFSVRPPVILRLSEIISLNVARPQVRRKREEVVAVPITQNERRSPVARGLLGGAILGPAGLILGASSGLNSKITTTMQYETVTREYDGLGAPQLIIGTDREDYPYFKIKCANQEVADEWMFRIRGRQSKLGR